jgi:hypothetical protein
MQDAGLPRPRSDVLSTAVASAGRLHYIPGAGQPARTLTPYEEAV